MSRKGIRDAKAFCRTAGNGRVYGGTAELTKRWRRKVAATKGGKKDGALKGRRYDRKFEEQAQRCWSYRKNGSEDPPLQKADHHGSMESGRLALPDVLSARAGNRLGGIFLGHRLPANGTIFAPHVM